MQQRKHPGADHGEERHRLGEAVDGRAPFLEQQQQDGGDERAGMADADPPDEVGDGKAPGDRDVDAPNARPAIQQVADRHAEHQEHREGEREADEPEPLDADDAGVSPAI